MLSTSFDMNCQIALENLDLYLDRELANGMREDVVRHLEACPGCAREMSSRLELRGRLKSAVNGVAPSAGLETRVRASLNAAARWDRPSYFARLALPLAAMLGIGVGVEIAYQLGHLRVTTAS